MLKKIVVPLRLQARKCYAVLQKEKKIKPTAILHEETREAVENDTIKPRRHAGVVHRATILLPEWLPKAMKEVMHGYSVKDSMAEAQKFYRYLVARQQPAEPEVIDAKRSEVTHRVHAKYSGKEGYGTPEVDEKIKATITALMRKEVYSWPAIEYDKYKSRLYMLARVAADYAVLYKVLSEIQSRDKDFQPKTLLDFGSGIGTVSWVASKLWGQSLVERVCVDVSTEMNELAEKLQQTAGARHIKGTAFFRQFLPIGSVPTFDIVVSAYSSLELPNRKTRFDTLAELWRKTGKYLVLVEQGTKPSFTVMAEARAFILDLIEDQQDRTPYEAFLFAPCPHEDPCPKIKMIGDRCRFEAAHFRASFGKELVPARERYTYLIFKKGEKRGPKDCWPRIVEPVIAHSRHVICRMCTAEGKWSEMHFTKAKSSRPMYLCAKNSEWGDRLPIEIVNNDGKQIEQPQTVNEDEKQIIQPQTDES